MSALVLRLGRPDDVENGAHVGVLPIDAGGAR